VIEAALGHAVAARAHLRTAMRLDAGSAPLRERQTRAVLGRLR
jgi:hypothetical protein